MGWDEAIKDAFAVADDLKHAELTHALAVVRMEGAKLTVENARLWEELLALRELTRGEAAMVHRHSVYWKQIDGGGEEGPFCPTCWDGERKLVRMDEVRGAWRCAVCRRALYPGVTPQERRQLAPWQRGWIGSWFR
jgi:hypothetical protein